MVSLKPHLASAPIAATLTQALDNHPNTTSTAAALPDRTSSLAQAQRPSDPPLTEQLREFIQTVTADLADLERFYNISISRTRITRLGEYLSGSLNRAVIQFSPAFDAAFDQGSKVDWLLLVSFLVQRQQRLRDDWATADALAPLLHAWAAPLVELCEKRQRLATVRGQDAAQTLADAAEAVAALRARIARGELASVGRNIAYRGVRAVAELRERLAEWFAFYDGYDPVFSWWVRRPWQDFPALLQGLADVIGEKLVGVGRGDGDAIVGLPSGRDGILADLRAEMIPYSPEETIRIGEREYAWCEAEMVKASRELGYGDKWRRALEHVKTLYVPPGEQIYLVRDLAQEAVEYVRARDMVTIPAVAHETWRTFMMSPEQQKVSPFFLGGDNILVAHPTSSMPHADKLMSLRGNSAPFSRATVLHELLPGHHLQAHYMKRSRPHRQPFLTPFWTEGWAFYWEMILWDRGFPGSAENRIGMLFWRMHRCARIVFSLRFHLDHMTPHECIDYLVDKVGHERATAEGEVRRSFNGDYSPLYQAAYMLGALQLYALRREVVGGGRMAEKEFHDAVLRENAMPIELVRALLTGERLEPTFRPSWRFYGDLD